MNYRYRSIVFYFTFALLASPLPAFAKCLTNKMGTVYCSSYSSGGIALNSMDEPQCGKGECLKDSMDNILCSKKEGGGAAYDSMKNVKCLGGCEPASASMCEKGK